MKNKIILSAIVALFLFVGVSYAEAAGLNFTAPVTVILGGNPYVIEVGSTAETMSGTGTNSLTITLIAGESFTLSSAIGYNLETSPTVVTQVCNGSTNSVTVTAIGTTVITPNPVFTHCGAGSATPPPPPREPTSSRVVGSTGVVSGGAGATVAADGQVICPNGRTLSSNCSAVPVFGPEICPNGMTVSSNCTASEVPTVLPPLTCPNGQLLVSNCTIAPVVGPDLCPNGLTVSSNCTISPRPGTISPPSISPGGGFGYDFGLITIKLGSTGAACGEWQRFFNNITNAGLVLDGKCGSLTMTAARAWQAGSGLVADGALGPLSRAAAYRQAGQ